MKYLLLLVLVFFCFDSFSQNNLLEKSGRKYTYKDEVYKCKELGDVYKIHQESLDLYNSGRANKRAANVVAIVGVPFALGGFILTSSGSIEGLIFGILSIAASVVIELVALIPRGAGSAKLRKARKTFNFEMLERHGYQSETSLVFGVTTNGLGLVYQF